MRRLANMAASPRVADTKGTPFANNPVLAVQLPFWRSRFVLFMIFLVMLGLAGRAVWLQGISTDFLQKQGESRFARTLTLPATRGKILDRNGHVLATSIPVKAIWAIPEDVQEAPKEKLRQLARLLDLSERDLKRKLDSDKSFVYLQRQVENDVAEKIVKLGIPGIQTKKEYKRYYPEGPVMAHVVGFTNVEGRGQESVELYYQKMLGGVDGNRRVIKDRLGNIVEDMRAVREPQDGKDLVLSIDNRIQYIAQSKLNEAYIAHKAKAASIVVLDVKTGEVLALANLPSYNPNDRRGLTGAKLRNRVITDTYEPGSTIKPFTVAEALEKGIVSPSTRLQIGPGKLRIGNASIGDAHEFETLSVEQVVEKSSNIGTAKMALKLQPLEMWEMFTTVGFGQQPRIGFPGAAAGRVRPYEAWRPIEQATMSYGHGISTSLLQVAHAYMVFARNGDIIPLTFQKTSTQAIGQRVVSEKTASEIRRMLELAAGPEGTAPRAQVPGYRVAGKTGTSRKIVNGKYVKEYVSSFVGFAPASNPRIIVAVAIDEPSGKHYYGGEVAAPVFSSVTAGTLRTMNVAPDSLKTNIVIPANGVKESI